MKRRDCLVMLAAVATAMRTVSAQDRSQVPKIGWLKIQDRADTPGWIREFRAGLAALGQVEGRSYVLEERYGDGDPSRLTPLADELIRMGVAMIVATSQPATEAARRATRTIPIIGRMTDDPVAIGMVRSLAAPDSNVTGIYSLLEEMSAKRLALLQQAVPSLRKIGALLSLDRGTTRHWLAQTEQAARRIGIAVYSLDIRRRDDLPTAFATASSENVNGLIAFRNPTIVTNAPLVIELSDRYRLPGIFDAREFVETGAFMSYGPNLDSIFSRLAYYADKLLRGVNVGALPIEQPTMFELVVNLKTAKALGIEISPAFLAQVDSVVE